MKFAQLIKCNGSKGFSANFTSTEWTGAIVHEGAVITLELRQPTPRIRMPLVNFLWRLVNAKLSRNVLIE